jgi:prepilin-type N-terminal cleavage/methylation domain-containing protein
LLTRAFSRFRSDESGFSLVELLTAMALGSIVLGAMLVLFVRGVTVSAQVNDRVEAAQRGRLAMDRVVTLLNSQTCLVNNAGLSTAPIVSGDANQVTFYANLGKVDADPLLYQLRYDGTAKALYEKQWVGTKDASANLTFPASPSVSKQLAANIVPTTAGAPIFQYWQFVTTAGPTLGAIDPVPLGTGGTLGSTDLAKTVRVTAAFAAQPERTKAQDLRSTSIQGTATVGSADPGEPMKGVNC